MRRFFSLPLWLTLLVTGCAGQVERGDSLYAQLGGGPCVYTGDSMRETHRHLQVTSAQFNRLVSSLIRVMEQEQIPVGAQNALLQRLAAMHGDIVAE